MTATPARDFAFSPLKLGAALSVVGAVLLTLVAFTREQARVDAPWTEPVPVGFTTLVATGTNDAKRAIPVAAWYPATSGEAPRLRLGDYIALADGKEKSGDPGAREALASQLEKSGAPRDEVERWMNALLWAHRDAPPQSARVPLVLLAAGNDESASDQAVLGERLASHGYVVVAAPFPTRIGTAPMASEDDVARVAEAQADDLAAMVNALAAWTTVDTSRIAVVGHSFGARAGLLLAMRDRRVRALISLDGGIGSATGRAAMERAPSFDAKRPSAPILHVYETMDAWLRPDRALLQELDSTKVWLAATHEMHHHHFTSFGAVAPGYAAVQRALGHTKGTAREYAAVNALVLRFIDAHLRDGAFADGASAGGIVVERLAPDSPRAK
jgi:dienelactone hydrolase